MFRAWNKGLTKETDFRILCYARKLSITNTGHIVSEETKKKQSLAHKNIPHSDEWNKNVSIALKKNPILNRRIGEQNGMYGKTHTKEVRKFLSDLSLELWQDPEYSAKVRAAHSNQEFRDAQSARFTELWKDPLYMLPLP